MSASLKTTQRGIQKKLDDMITRAETLTAFVNRVVYPIYQRYQRRRWMDENSRQTGQWQALNSAYAERKKRMYGGMEKRGGGTWPSYPGQGTKMLIATGRLSKSVMGDDASEHRKIVTNKSLRIFTTVPYATYVNDVRDFSTYGKSFYREVGAELKKYVAKG